MFVIVGGKPESGYAQLTAAIIGELDEKGHCSRIRSRRGLPQGRGSTVACRDCPESLETTSFFRTVRLAHDTVYRSARHARDQQGNYPQGRGVVVIQRRHISVGDALLNVSDCRKWLDEDSRECMHQVLMERGEWLLGPSASKEH